jgi:hypothetical protein
MKWQEEVAALVAVEQGDPGDEEEDDKIRGVIVSLNIILSWCDLHT